MKAYNTSGASDYSNEASIAIPKKSGFENEVLSPVDLYPNPADGVVHIRFYALQDVMQIIITDVLGRIKELNTVSVISGQMDTVTLDVSTLQPGIYFVRVIVPGKSHRTRILIIN